MKSSKKGSTRQMMGITAMENDQVNTAMGDLVYYAVKPTNMGVLPESSIRDRVQALQRLLQGQGELEMMALNAWQSFAHNRDFYRERMEQELLAPAGSGDRNLFQVLMDKLPSDHKAKWFAGAALNASGQAMASVMSTVLSRLNSFLDTELEQVLCFDSQLDAERFSWEKSAIFLILPEEDTTKNFMAGLLIQTLARELFALADEHGGKLPRRVVFFCDELGTMPPFDILPLFSAGRSRKLTLVPIIQSLAQLEKNYGKEGAEIIVDNVQDTIFGGFAPNSQTAETLSKALGSRTVLSGSVSQGKDSKSQSLQMMERALMTPDELKAIPKGQFFVMKTGTHPMMTRLRLFLDWGITFEEPYAVPARENRTVHYAGRAELMRGIAEARHKVSREQSGKEHIKV